MSTQTTIDSDELFIGGEWIKPRGSDRISVLAASTEEVVGSVPDGTNADVDAAVNAARGAFEASGIGRALGPEGLDAYLQLQSIYKARPQATDAP
jgi:aldehyde dehydrogenase (NAD+)